MANWTQANTSAFSAMLKYACLDGSLAGSFAKLLAPFTLYRACPCVTFYSILAFMGVLLLDDVEHIMTMLYSQP